MAEDETNITDRSDLIQYFHAGKSPTGSQFKELIQSFIHKKEDSGPITIAGDDANRVIDINGNLNLPVTRIATEGVIMQNNASLLHTHGSKNLFVGAGAGNFSGKGNSNTGIGHRVLEAVAGDGSKENGGMQNTGTGAYALFSNKKGWGNTADGCGSLSKNTTGNFNTAVGGNALNENETGSNNIALGVQAGRKLQGDNNIAIGNQGAEGDNNTIRIGTSGTHARTILVGKAGIGTDNPTKAKLEINGNAGSQVIGPNVYFTNPGTSLKTGASTAEHIEALNEKLKKAEEKRSAARAARDDANTKENAAKKAVDAISNFHDAEKSRPALEALNRAKTAAKAATNAYNAAEAVWKTAKTQFDQAAAKPQLNAQFSLHCSHWVSAAGFSAHSDRRIKEPAGRSEWARDLKTLMDIEITDYTFKDARNKGVGPQKKVIAQQVETVFPQAVSRGIDVVPDIYEAAPVKGGWVELDTDLEVGERVRLIGEREEGIHEVLELRDGAFRTAFRPATDKVFVYGREVDDFRGVDYDAIAMLNVSATQQVKREKDAEIKVLREDNAALRQTIDALISRVGRLEDRMSRPAFGGALPENPALHPA